jgi:hypothetical protein
MSVAPASLPPAAPNLSPGAPPAAPRPSAFHTLLSELNPLQYLPVIGTVYRAATGDVIPEAARTAGSLVVSFLLGGPIGVALSVGAIAAEKLTGIDPEAIGQHVLADIGLGHAPSHPAPARPGPAAPASPGWPAAQLAALGVTSVNGVLHHGGLNGADVLNDLELARLHPTRTDVTV